MWLKEDDDFTPDSRLKYGPNPDLFFFIFILFKIKRKIQHKI